MNRTERQPSAVADTPKSKTLRGAGLCALLGIFFSFAAASIYTAIFLQINAPDALSDAGARLGAILSLSNLLRAAVLLPLGLLASAMLLWGAKATLEKVFAWRWLIAGSVFVLYLICGINFSNAGYYHLVIQPDLGGNLCSPLFGMVRGIRSDEWLVNVPLTVSSDYAGYGEFNEILRGTVNYNLPATGLYLSYAALADPLNFGYFLFGAVGGMSFFWCGTMLLAIMLSLEFSYIISGKRKLFALLGVGLIALSPFNLWWSVSALLTGFMGILVCAYYCFQAKKFWVRCFCMAGVALSGAYFICQFYPAWQVPMVYILLPLFLWIIIENFDVLRAFGKRDWIAAAVAVAFMASVILSYLLGISEYTKAIMGTVYPGERFETGGYALQKAFSFIQTFRFPFRDVTVGSNNSEAGVFFSLFPLPTLMALYAVIRQIVANIKNKTKKIDLLTLLLLLPALFIGAFCTVGFPDWLARLTLMSYSPPTRAVDWLCFIDVLLLIRLASRREDKLPTLVAVGAVGLTVVNSILQSQSMCPGYLSDRYTLVISLATLLFGMSCFASIGEKNKKAILTSFALIAIAAGLAVSPVNSGLESLTKKPAAVKIQEISASNPEAKWIGYGNLIVGQYAVANGAPCITSTNYIPNMELWERLDPDGEYAEIYNRYAHVTLLFTEEETSFTLLGPDHIRVDLCYEDIALTECRYLFSLMPVAEESDAVDFCLVYHESNAFIYEIVYLP